MKGVVVLSDRVLVGQFSALIRDLKTLPDQDKEAAFNYACDCVKEAKKRGLLNDKQESETIKLLEESATVPDEKAEEVKEVEEPEAQDESEGEAE